MELLSLALIGWLYTIGSALALLLGAVLVVLAKRAGGDAQRELARRKLEDSVLFGVWIVGLAGGVGLLLGKVWSLLALEFFSWVLIGLTLFSVIARARHALGAEGGPRPGMRLAGLALFALPIIALCAATIITLRNESTLRALSGS